MTDYTGIVEKVKEVLDSGLNEYCKVEVEPPMVGESPQPEIGIFLATEKNRERVIGPTDPYMATITIHVLCSEYSPDGVSEACRLRDTLIGKVRTLLKGNRTLGGLVDITQLGDVEFQTAQTQAGFFSAARIHLTAFVTS